MGYVVALLHRHPKGRTKERGDEANEAQSWGGLQDTGGVRRGPRQKTLAELAPQFGVPPTQTTEWKPQLLAQAVGVCGGMMKATVDALDLQALHAKIGPLALEHDVLEGARALRRASLDGRRETNTDLIPAGRNTSKLGKIIGCVQ